MLIKKAGKKAKQQVAIISPDYIKQEIFTKFSPVY